ncbi:MAG: hypothetical protein JJ971_04210 [Balneolaceae bacterium]|nr:hypothetical protein [Balneolaceae bacterium]MBO6545577.1 hypothetical protein [Balneolaceae bacterium]MBO6646973.1 hypothetical protein [Balneolaceae bacterium]
MNFELELNAGQRIQFQKKEQLLDIIDTLDGKERSEVSIYKGKIFFLRVESDPFKRIHIYRRSLNKIKQTVQPISKAVCKKLVSDFLDGNRSWYKGVKFIDAEPSVPEKNYEIEDTLEELEGRERKTIVLALSGILVSVLFGLYMYSRLDTMSNMNLKVYAILMGGIIGGPVLFIYLIFEVFEMRKKIEKMRNKKIN